MTERVWIPEGLVFEKREGVEECVRTRGYAPDPRLAAYVTAYWTMDWELPAGESYESLVVPSGCVNLIFGESNARATGVRQSVFRYTVAGAGRAIGVLFNIGGFYPYHLKPVDGFMDNAIPLSAAFAGIGQDLPQRLNVCEDFDGKRQLLDAFFLNEHPAAVCPEMPLVSAVAAFIVGDEGVLTTRQVLERFAIGERTLQRVFTKIVGIGPKSLIRTKRFQTAIKAMMAGAEIDWADFALRLGYFDQAHFINDFRKITGRSPGNLELTSV